MATSSTRPSRHDASPTVSPRAVFWLATTAIVAGVFVAFLPVLDAGFLNWDDDQNFVTNTRYRGLTLEHLTWMFTTFHYGGYHPLSWVSVAVDHAVWGMNPKGYHLTNLAIHIANCLLVFALIRSVLRLARPMAPDTNVDILLTAGATLLFATHPLRVEAVAWITERRALLAAFFWLLTLLLYLRSRSAAAARPRLLFWLSVVTYLFSLLSKGMAITLPVVLLLADLYPLRRWPTGAANRSRLWRLLLEKIPFVAVAIGVGILARFAQQEGAAVRSFAEHPLLDRIAQASFGLLFYLVKTVAPTGLAALHPLEHRIDWTGLAFVGSMLVVVALTLLAVLGRRRWPACAATWFAYALILAPVSGIVQSGPQLVAERYSYLPMVPVAALLAGALTAAVGERRIRSRTPILVALSTTIIACIVACIVASYRQSQVWHDSVSLWRRVVTVHPDSIQGHFNLGSALAATDRSAQAAAAFETCAALAPTHGAAFYHAGLSSLRSQEFARARTHLERALELRDTGYWPMRPAPAEHLYCLGLAYHEGTDDRGANDRAANDAAAVRYLDRAIQADPRYAPAYRLLADTELRRGNRDAAARTVERGLAILPGDSDLLELRRRLQKR